MDPKPVLAVRTEPPSATFLLTSGAAANALAASTTANATDKFPSPAMKAPHVPPQPVVNASKYATKVDTAALPLVG